MISTKSIDRLAGQLAGDGLTVTVDYVTLTTASTYVLSVPTTYRAPGSRHSISYEIHFDRHASGGWRFAGAFIRTSTGDGNNDQWFTTIKALRADIAARWVEQENAKTAEIRAARANASAAMPAEPELTELTVTTPEIREGDIVLNHGMRILIDGPANVFHGGCLRHALPLHGARDAQPEMVEGAECLLGYAWPGTVLNVDEVREAHIIPMSFLYDNARYTYGPGHGREDFWNTQGNARARWRVLRSA